uniref:Uncharacterized protein n=1 Tax=Magallana gigas TaxID=29159 RepID=K1Q0P8_MAGGI
MSTLGSHLEWLYNPNERQRRKLPGGAGCHGKANRRKWNFDLDLIRADDLMDVSGTKYNVFRCIKWKQLTPNSYRYYIREGE